METLREVLSRHVREAALYQPLEGQRVECFACGHRCRIRDGHEGVCKVRFNRGGRLMAPYGYVTGLQCDPIEKKPFFHCRPGALALSFGMLGCDLHCSYCQNWVTSQARRDPAAGAGIVLTEANSLAERAVEAGAEAVVSTYNEPLITAEWALDVFRHARARGLMTGFVSNGNATPEALCYLRPSLDLFKVDLKSFEDRHYRKLGGRLAPILDTIQRAHQMGFWVEVVTLLIPGFNDAEPELEQLTNFLAEVSVEIPWHVTAFHRDYKMLDTADTTPAMLLRAAQIGRRAGLRYIYAGNAPGQVGDLENTRCPECSTLLLERRGYRILLDRLSAAGSCPHCGLPIPGHWGGGGRRSGDRQFPWAAHARVENTATEH